jgi:hypothetical protein
MLTSVTDILIEELINSGEMQDARSRHLYMHALYGLVRVARAEQLQQFRRDVALATGKITQAAGCEDDPTEST